MSFSELWGFVQTDPTSDQRDTARIELGSVGYERFKTSAEFAATLARHGITRLIDVRELPISRKAGFAKTALAEALAEEGIEYIHERGLGNPKEFRDLYKAGSTELGRAAYKKFLLKERRETLRGIVPLIERGTTALMCVEHDSGTCHRDVIFEALRHDLGLSLAVRHLGSDI